MLYYASSVAINLIWISSYNYRGGVPSNFLSPGIKTSQGGNGFPSVYSALYFKSSSSPALKVFLSNIYVKGC